MPAEEQQSATIAAPTVPTTTSTNVFAAAVGVYGRIIANATTGILYVKYGAGASSTSWTFAIPAGQSLVFPSPLYAGPVEVSAVVGGTVITTQW
jgi:hypothetical protein